MKAVRNIISLIFISIISLSCDKGDFAVFSCDLSTKTLERFSNRIGNITFYKSFGKYVINYPVPGTIDSEITGIICNLPEELMKDGLKVNYSGKYKEGDTGFKPELGGQEIYFLELTKISLN